MQRRRGSEARAPLSGCPRSKGEEVNLTDLIPSTREIVFLIAGTLAGALLLLLGALMSAAGTADDHDERTRGIRRS